MKVLQDLRFFFREVRKKPGLALTAIISLALGIGATTAVFSVMYGLLANPFPCKGADRMIHLTVVNESGDDWWIGVTGPQLKLLRQAKCIESVAASWGTWNLTTTDEDLPQDVPSVQLTGNAGTHFGVPALLGRTLIPSDDPEGRDPEPVVVLSYLFWQRHFNSDRSVVGRRLQLVHKNYTIVGVLCPRSGAPVASAAQRRCWLVGPAPVGAGEASARSPTAVRSPLRSAPLHSWPSAPGINRRPLPNRSACRVPPTPGQGLYVATPRLPPLSALYPAGRPRAPVPQPGRLALGPQNATRDRYPLGIELAAGPGLPAPLHRVAVVVPFPPGSGHLLPWRTARKSPIRLATPPSPPACARVPNPHNSGCGSALRAGASVFAGPHTGRQPSARSLPWTPPNVRPAPPVDTCSASPDRPLPRPVPGSPSAPGCSAPGAPLLPSPAPSRGAPGRRVASRSPPAGPAPVGSPRRETNGPPRCATRHPQYPPAAQNRLLPTGRPWRKMPATLGRFPWKRSWPADGWPPWPPRSVVGKAPRARS